MKIAVLGSGAMGGLYSSYLSRHNEVTVIDVNAALVEKVNAEGLEVQEPDGTSNVFHPHAVLSTEGMEPVDLIIVFVKAMFSEGALNNNKGIIGPDTYIMTLQNGSGHEDLLGKFVPQDHIIIGTTQHNASVAGLGVTKHGGSGMTHMGCVVGEAARLQKFADTFTECGLEADVSDGVQKMIWNKLFTNVSASALTGARSPRPGNAPRAGSRGAGAPGLYLFQRARLEALLPADPRGCGCCRRPGHGLRL